MKENTDATFKKHKLLANLNCRKSNYFPKRVFNEPDNILGIKDPELSKMWSLP